MESCARFCGRLNLRLARVQRENSYNAWCFISRDRRTRSSGENDASTGSRSVTETPCCDRGPPTIRQHNATSTRRRYSDEVNYATHDGLPGPTTNRISASHVEQTDTGRESPDLYGATPPRTRTLEPTPKELGVAYGRPQHAMVVATLEDADRENDSRLYGRKHQDTEGDFAIPELMPDTASTTSVQRPAAVLKRQWTK